MRVNRFEPGDYILEPEPGTRGALGGDASGSPSDSAVASCQRELMSSWPTRE